MGSVCTAGARTTPQPHITGKRRARCDVRPPGALAWHRDRSALDVFPRHRRASQRDVERAARGGVAMTRTTVLGAGPLAAIHAIQDPPPRFRSGTESVSVDVLVLDGNRPVAGLSTSAFDLRDSGVRQSITADR